MKDRIELDKTQLGALLDAKDGEIKVLSEKLQQQTAVKQEEQEKVDELKLYIKMQEAQFSEHSAKLELEKDKLTRKHTEFKAK